MVEHEVDTRTSRIPHATTMKLGLGHLPSSKTFSLSALAHVKPAKHNGWQLDTHSTQEVQEYPDKAKDLKQDHNMLPRRRSLTMIIHKCTGAGDWWRSTFFSSNASLKPFLLSHLSISLRFPHGLERRVAKTKIHETRERLRVLRPKSDTCYLNPSTKGRVISRNKGAKKGQ